MENNVTFRKKHILELQSVSLDAEIFFAQFLFFVSTGKGNEHVWQFSNNLNRNGSHQFPAQNWLRKSDSTFKKYLRCSLLWQAKEQKSPEQKAMAGSSSQIGLHVFVISCTYTIALHYFPLRYLATTEQSILCQRHDCLLSVLKTATLISIYFLFFQSEFLYASQFYIVLSSLILFSQQRISRSIFVCNMLWDKHLSKERKYSQRWCTFCFKIEKQFQFSVHTFLCTWVCT